jgi:hypothetical protein
MILNLTCDNWIQLSMISLVFYLFLPFSLHFKNDFKINLLFSLFLIDVFTRFCFVNFFSVCTTRTLFYIFIFSNRIFSTIQFESFFRCRYGKTLTERSSFFTKCTKFFGDKFCFGSTLFQTFSMII